MIEIETRSRILIWRTFGRIQWQTHVSHCRVLPAGKFNGMSSQSHISHCRVLPPGEFNEIYSQSHMPHCGVCHLVNSMSLSQIHVPHRTVLPPSEFSAWSRSHNSLYVIFFLIAVWALASGGFRIVFDILVVLCYDAFDAFCATWCKDRNYRIIINGNQMLVIDFVGWYF